MELRDYQRASVDMTIESLDAGEAPCLMLPTAGGKSVICADLCRILHERGQRVLMLTHVKELIEQGAKRLNDHWRDLTGGYFAPVGVYSSGLGKKQFGQPITYAGIQSIYAKLSALQENPPHVIIVDEAHLIPTKGEGRYRTLFSALPTVRRVGLTATPWRLGHGSLTEGEGALFNRLLQPPGTTVREMVDAGRLATLRSKHTDVRLLDLVKAAGVHTRGGDYVESELDAAVNQAGPNELIAAEILRRADEGDRRHGLIFCVSVAHAQQMARILTSLGALCGVVTGDMSSLERTDTLTRFRVGELRFVANVNVLTTGYDFADLDLLAFCRPTKSPVLYVQMAGRGMRLKVDGTTPHRDCMVLDFAGLVGMHGPITDVRPPRAKGSESGETPTKNCPVCAEIVLISCMVCPSCAFEFPAPEKKAQLHNDDIMATVRTDGSASVASWSWFKHKSSYSGRDSIACEYRFSLPVRFEAGKKDYTRATEYFSVWTEGQPGEWARDKLKRVATACGATLYPAPSMTIDSLNAARPPLEIKVELNGSGYVQVGRKKWPAKQETAA